MGGGTDVDAAYKWMISNSGGGDILILRTSGDDAYNPYIFGLGKVNTVSTILLEQNSSSGGSPASDPFVLMKVNNCEGLWLAGGDQWTYYSWWKDTLLLPQMRALIKNRVTIGGTSAGMAILAEYPYVAQFDSVSSTAALNDPYNYQMTLGNDYLRLPFLSMTVFDSHFVQRDRMGRTVAFVARIMTDMRKQAYGIACDQATAILISESGVGTVVTQKEQDSDFDDPLNKAYILVPTEPPDLCQKGTPLAFVNIQIFRLGNGDRFYFPSWNTTDGSYYIMYADAGRLSTDNNGGKIY